MHAYQGAGHSHAPYYCLCVCVHASMTQRNSLTSSEPNEHLISCKFRSS
jgi:hypothetical protein